METEQLLAAQLGLGRLLGVELAEQVQLRGRGEIEQALKLAHEVDLAAALEDVGVVSGCPT